MKINRYWAIPLLIGLALIGFYALRRPPLSGDPSLGAASAANIVTITAAPPMDTSPDAVWSQYDVSLPAKAGPLECRLYTIRDGRGDGYVSFGPMTVGPKPIRMSFRLNCDLDRKMKAILQAQGLPTKPNIVTYTSDFFCGGGGFPNQIITLRFAHSGSGTGEWSGQPTTGTYHLGERIPLVDAVFKDDEYAEVPNIFLMNYPNDATFTSHFPPDMAHRVTLQAMFVAQK